MRDLLPCPFCGSGETRLDPATHWTGQRSEVICVRVRHWCPPKADGRYFRSYIEMAGKTEADAITAWNERAAQRREVG